jgi:hypothetical protein
MAASATAPAGATAATWSLEQDFGVAKRSRTTVTATKGVSCYALGEPPTNTANDRCARPWRG